MTKQPSPLAEFEIHVMLAVARFRDDAYGARIRREIEERGRRRVSMGAVSPPSGAWPGAFSASSPPWPIVLLRTPG